MRPDTTARRRIAPEVAGYVLLAVGLFALLWHRVSQVDGFYLDEWIYVHGAQYMWTHFPSAVLGEIPLWTRGPQRAYSWLLAPPWGVLSTSTAYTVTHVMNVVLMVSGILPAALYARRIIASPPLRVLAVALGVAVPWLMISAHLLTENLAFPLYLWVIYLIVRTTDQPSLVNQALAIVAVALLGLVRLNLAPMFAVLVLAVVVAETGRRRGERSQPLRGWVLTALRREALVVVATLLALLAAIVLLARGSGSLGAYGGFTFHSISDSIFGSKAELTRRTFLTYSRSLVVGSFVLPMALGLGASLAGLFGRLGRPLVQPAIVAVAGFVVVLSGVSIWTAGAALEDRYVFYVYTPLAVFAVVALEHLSRLARWVACGSLLTLWALIAGLQAAGVNYGHFFASPSGAFWSRVVFWRLRRYENDFLGWTLLGQPGWLLLAIGLLVVVWLVMLARTHERLSAWLLGAGLAICLAAQVVSLDYDFKQELYGTRDARGGIAGQPGHSRDREDWLDPRVPDGAQAGVVPGLMTMTEPNGGQDRLSFWNRDLDVTVSTPWNGAPTPAPPGFTTVVTTIGANGLATWQGDLPSWLAAYRDDPRIQFAGRFVAQSPSSRFALYRPAPARTALWTGTGVDGDGAVVQSRPARFVLDRRADRSARFVLLTLRGPQGGQQPAHWRVSRGGKVFARGWVRSGADAHVRLRIPRCGDNQCPPVSWRLTASGPAVPISFPVFGPPPAPRPVVLYVNGAHIG
jgi:hypothetical protein